MRTNERSYTQKSRWSFFCKFFCKYVYSVHWTYVYVYRLAYSIPFSINYISCDCGGVRVCVSEHGFSILAFICFFLSRLTQPFITNLKYLFLLLFLFLFHGRLLCVCVCEFFYLFRVATVYFSYLYFAACARMETCFSMQFLLFLLVDVCVLFLSSLFLLLVDVHAIRFIYSLTGSQLTHTHTQQFISQCHVCNSHYCICTMHILCVMCNAQCKCERELMEQVCVSYSRRK